jgi:hypothetical protein
MSLASRIIACDEPTLQQTPSQPARVGNMSVIIVFSDFLQTCMGFSDLEFPAIESISSLKGGCPLDRTDLHILVNWAQSQFGADNSCTSILDMYV